MKFAKVLNAPHFTDHLRLLLLKIRNSNKPFKDFLAISLTYAQQICDHLFPIQRFCKRCITNFVLAAIWYQHYHLSCSAVCWQFNCKRLLIVSDLDITWFSLKRPEISVSLTLKLVSAIFYQIFVFPLHDSPSKTMKGGFYFIRKALFVLKICKLL